MPLPPAQFQELYRSLLAAFPLPGELHRFARSVADFTTMRTDTAANTCEDLITWAESRGALDTLLNAALAVQPNNVALRAAVQAINPTLFAASVTPQAEIHKPQAFIALSSIGNPFEPRSTRMIGRERESEQILSKIQAGVHCSIIGPDGSGRRTLVDHILNKVKFNTNRKHFIKINLQTIEDLSELKFAIVVELGGKRVSDWRKLWREYTPHLFIVKGFEAMPVEKKGLIIRNWLAGIAEETTFLVTSTFHLTKLFSNDPSTPSPLADIFGQPVLLKPLSAKYCQNLVEDRLSLYSLSSMSYSHIYNVPRQPQELLNLCAAYYEHYNSMSDSTLLESIETVHGQFNNMSMPSLDDGETEISAEVLLQKRLSYMRGFLTSLFGSLGYSLLGSRPSPKVLSKIRALSTEIRSPYVVGAIVPPDRLVGREALLTEIGRLWGKSDVRDSLVIFGHRRMGKSSLVRSLAKLRILGDATTLVVLNTQIVDWTQGSTDLCYAIAFSIWQARPLVGAEPQPDAYAAHPLQALRRFLAALQQRQYRQRYILILDEYEVLDQSLPALEAEAFVTTLRGFTQDFPWLTVALVGLHTLQERSARYYSPLYSWRTLKVSFLTRDGVADLLQFEDDDFPLEYSLDAIDHVAALTGGQPYLAQLMGDSLVKAFNARFRQATVPPAPTLTAADVAAVVADPAFYESGGGYFHGIWGQVAEGVPGQRALLQALAAASAPLSAEDLAAATGLPAPTVAAALETLAVHDVLRPDAGGWVYTVPLMQRWVAGFAPPG